MRTHQTKAPYFGELMVCSVHVPSKVSPKTFASGGDIINYRYRAVSGQSIEIIF